VKAWLITIDDKGNIEQHTEFDNKSLSIAQALMSDHAAHNRIFFNGDCADCVSAYGPTGSRW